MTYITNAFPFKICLTIQFVWKQEVPNLGVHKSFSDLINIYGAAIDYLIIIHMGFLCGDIVLVR